VSFKENWDKFEKIATDTYDKPDFIKIMNFETVIALIKAAYLSGYAIRSDEIIQQDLERVRN
jgi:hypothetical protein